MVMPFPIPSIPPVNILKRIFKVGKVIWDVLFGNNGPISQQEPLDPKKNNTDDIMALNSALIDYRQEVKAATSELENSIKKTCKEVFEEVLESLEFANQKFEFYRTNSLKRKIDNFTDDIDGIFEKHTSKRISLDDNDCIAILKMMPGELKGKRMKELKENVFKESIYEIIKKMNDFIEEFFETMEYSVENRINDISDKIEERTNIFEKLSLDADNKNNTAESIELASGYIINIAALAQEA